MYRFQRVSPMEVSPYDQRVVYYGSQYVHRTRDGGVTWTRISPDLTAHPPGTQGASGEPITRDATGEEVYSTLYSIRESTAQKGVIWTGSNDGLVFVSRNDGETWANVTPAGLPPGGRVQNVEPSPHRAGTAYVAIYRFLLRRLRSLHLSHRRLRQDLDAYHGRQERHRAGRADASGARRSRSRGSAVCRAPSSECHLSYDNGAHWQSFQQNLPVTPVTDIKVAHKDLVLSTQGRSFWIMDNLTPLHQIPMFQQKQKVVTTQAHLFQPREAVRSSGGRGGGRRGAGPQYPLPGAMIDYYLASAPVGGYHSRSSRRIRKRHPPVLERGWGGAGASDRRSSQ